jgi:chemosensory pili system protein ChpE
MTDLLAPLFLAGSGLGLACSLLPGPVMAETLRRGALAGPAAAVAVRLGSLAGALAWAGLTFAVGAAVVGRQPACLLLNALGAATMPWIAWGSLAAFARKQAAASGRAPAEGGLLTGAALTLLSPLEPLFWLATARVVLTAPTPAGQAVQALAFLAGLVLSDILATAGLWAAIACGRRRLSIGSLRWPQLVSGGAVGHLGLRLATAAVQAL